MEMISQTLKDAIRNLRYLLDQGYPRTSAVKFVSDHYRLELERRHFLARCVFSSKESANHRKKLVDFSEVRGRKLGIDGYNVLITIESILEGKRVVICDDGFVRDLRAIFGKYKMSKVTENALDKLLAVAAKADPDEVVLLFDKQVSKSGELASMARGKLDEMGLEGNARTTVGTDMGIRDFAVVSSSDRGIIEKKEAVWDIPREILEDEKAEVIKLSEV